MLFYNPIRNLESVKTLRHQQPKLALNADCCLKAIFFLFLSAVFPVLFDCCTEVAHHIPRRWLRTVATFDIQNGAVGKKKMCVCVVCVQLWNGENDLKVKLPRSWSSRLNSCSKKLGISSSELSGSHF
uniref:Uncharacterized protein n=1 Tax=Podarcis muralis TaxID=64176 RepID=A0A670JNC3_PODMU